MLCLISSNNFLLGAHFKAWHIWYSIIESIHKRLTGWKSQQTHSNLKAHFLAFQRISYLNSDCLQEWQKGWKKKSRVKQERNSNSTWNVCCTPICNGGLGIKQLCFYYQPLLGSGCDAMGQKKMHYGGGCYIQALFGQRDRKWFLDWGMEK